MISDLRRKSAFTLLEILLVLLVVGIAAAAFMPVAMNTVDNSRTRSALRDVISINRYARARAILDQKPTAVIYLGKEDKLQLLSLPPRRDSVGETLFGQAAVEDPEISDASSVELLRSRKLPKFVQVASVDGAEQEEDGFFVIYEENGITANHQVILRDPGGREHSLHINGLTGEILLDD